MTTQNTALSIAACGIHCNYCFAYVRKKNQCPGCRGSDEKKPITRIICKIKNCEHILNGNNKFCFECSTFPCDKMIRIDKRYRNTYKISLINNLENIKLMGINKFQEAEENKWKCRECGNKICLHTRKCIECNR
jgi:hypothetical protein